MISLGRFSSKAPLWQMTQSLLLGSRPFSTSQACQGPPPPALLAIRSLDSDNDHALARRWLDEFSVDDIPKDAYEVSYARSSGPGGQHVNKTNSKAVVRCDVGRARGVWLPPFVASALEASPHYHAPSLLFSSQATRSAPQNLVRALDDLHATIVNTGRSLIRGETSIEQRKRVQSLIKAEAAKRRVVKDKQRSKKESRRKDW